MTISRKTWVIAAAWAAVLVIALVVDGPVAEWVHRTKPISRHWVSVRYIKRAGNFTYVGLIALLIPFIHFSRWRAGLILIVASALSGVFYGTKWIFGRQRPSYVLEPYSFDLFKDGGWGLFYAQRMSLPSGHACLSFAAASCLAALFPRGAIAFYAVAVLLGIERVLEGAHYPSDVVVGASFGILSTYLALRLAVRWFGPEWNVKPLCRRGLEIAPPLADGT
jgi:membrane-associated phospholipid phosphatase